MSKQIGKIIENVESVASSIQEFSKPLNPQDYKTKESAPLAQVTNAQKRNVDYLKPRRSIKVKTTVPLTGERLRERGDAWEYVDGVFENRVIAGESVTLWMNPFPGDDYAEWCIPCNKPIALPKWLARHLSSRSYITFKYAEKPANAQQINDFTHAFVPDYLTPRMTFSTLNSY